MPVTFFGRSGARGTTLRDVIKSGYGRQRVFGGHRKEIPLALPPQTLVDGTLEWVDRAGNILFSINDEGDVAIRGDTDVGGDVDTGGTVISYVGKELAFTIGADPNLSDLLHARVQIADALAKLVSTTDPTANTDLIWAGFSSSDPAPFYYMVSGVLTAWPAAGAPQAAWGIAGYCIVPQSANALVSGTTYYRRLWMWDGAAYSQCDDAPFVA